MDQTRGSDYVTREDYESSSSDGSDYTPADSQSPSPPVPPAAPASAQDRPPAPKVEASDSAAGPLDEAPQGEAASSSQHDSKRIKTNRTTMPPLVLPPSAAVAPAPALAPATIQTSPQPDQPNQEERPVKRRVVLAQVYFRYGQMTKFLYDHGKLRVQEIEMTISNFLIEHDFATEILWYACKEQVYLVQEINTVIVDFKLADICLARLKELPWIQCKVLGSRGIFANYFPTNEIAQQKVGVGYSVGDATSPAEDSSSSSDSTAQPPMPPPLEGPSSTPSPCTALATPNSPPPSPEGTQPAPPKREGNPDSSSTTESS